MVKKYYKDGPSIVDPAAKCLISESELRLDLEKRIKEAEDSMELAALVQAWCQIPKNYNIEGQISLEWMEAQTKTAIKEFTINLLMFALGAAVVIVFLVLS